jgi:hypothetical protein
MPQSLIKRLLAVISISSVIIVLGWAAVRYMGTPPANDAAPSTQPSQEKKSFDFVIVQQALDRRRITVCRSDQCQVAPPPASESTTAVTDGTWWYHYRDGVLMRTALTTGESKLVIEQTPLVKPRGLFLSPDNNKVAFWLDNIDDPAEQLTELWVYDQPAGGTKLLAEKLLQPGVLTVPRWNRSSTQLWVLGQGGDPAAPKTELLVVSLNPPGISARFNGLNWDALGPVADGGPMDISPDGTSLIYAEPKTAKTSYLHVVSGENNFRTTTVRGAVPYVQWFRTDRLLYATQEASDFTFWLAEGTRHRRLAKSEGHLQSVRVSPNGDYLAFTVAGESQRIGIFTLGIEDSTVTEQLAVPVFGSATYLVHAQPSSQEPSAGTGGIRELEDSELAAFVEQNMAGITGAAAAEQKRLIITDKPNMVYLDFTSEASELQRVLLTVQDTLHPEWSISARFVERGGEWVQTDGGSLPEHKALRLYEWESQLARWILKEEF